MQRGALDEPGQPPDEVPWKRPRAEPAASTEAVAAAAESVAVDIHDPHSDVDLAKTRIASHVPHICTVSKAWSEPGPTDEEWVRCECHVAKKWCRNMVRWDAGPIGRRLCTGCRLPAFFLCGCNCDRCDRGSRPPSVCQDVDNNIV